LLGKILTFGIWHPKLSTQIAKDLRFAQLVVVMIFSMNLEIFKNANTRAQRYFASKHSNSSGNVGSYGAELLI